MTDAAIAGQATGLHHAGLVVKDMDAAIETFRRLGFTVPEAAFPGLATGSGGEHQGVGAGNTHLRLDDNFIELVAVVRPDGHLGANAVMVPMEVPAERVPAVREVIARTTGRIAEALERFEGLHILALEARDLDAAADRLAASGVQHSGVSRLRQPVGTPEDTVTVPVAYLEIDETLGRAPEGRIALAELPDVEARRWQRNPGHPNGARRLTSVVLCVSDGEVASTVRRYEAYAGRSARSAGRHHVLELGHGSVIVVGQSDLPQNVAWAQPVDLPAFVAYEIQIEDLAATASYLDDVNIPVRRSLDGSICVAPDDALGAVIIFSEESQRPAPS